MLQKLTQWSNAVTAQFDIREQIGSGGPGSLWKIHDGNKKAGAKPQCAVFTFEKNFLETVNPLAKPTQMKREQDRVIEILKKEAQMLARFRHPMLLELAEPLNDNRLILAFATEGLLCNLANALGDFTNFSTNTAAFLQRTEMDELEIQKGLLQVVKGLEFLHSNRIVHGNLTPSSIYINSKGDWKVGGFNFCVNLGASSDGTGKLEYRSHDPPYCSPDLDFMAPECVQEERCDTYSDLWSFGCLIYALFNKGRSPMHCGDNTYAYQSRLQELQATLSPIEDDSIPSTLRDCIRALMVRSPAARMSLADFQMSPHFDSVLVNTIRFLESFVEKGNVDKAQFLKGLVKIVPQFSKKTVYRKILPLLLQEFKDPAIVPFILPNVFLIIEDMTPEQFGTDVLPPMKPIFKLMDPPQAALLLLSRFDLFAKKCPTSEAFKNDVMPLLYSSLEANTPILQEQALKVVPSVLEKLDFTSVRSILFAKLQTLYMSATTLSVKVQTLIAVHAAIKSLDKFTLTEKLIPMLKSNIPREPGLMMALLVVYEELARHLEKEAIAREIMPELWKQCTDPLLNFQQFTRYMKVVKELTAKVEEAQLRHLETVGKMQSTTAEKSEDTFANFNKLVKNQNDDRRSFESTSSGFSSGNPPRLPSRPEPTNGNISNPLESGNTPVQPMRFGTPLGQMNPWSTMNPTSTSTSTSISPTHQHATGSYSSAGFSGQKPLQPTATSRPSLGSPPSAFATLQPTPLSGLQSSGPGPIQKGMDMYFGASLSSSSIPQTRPTSMINTTTTTSFGSTGSTLGSMGSSGGGIGLPPPPRISQPSSTSNNSAGGFIPLLPPPPSSNHKSQALKDFDPLI
ncbi:kinase-like domain-containing protein [Cladochytrium replicatum]|nr:kinase-like domain-containing protein [Cladochytrium replicatum]